MSGSSQPGVVYSFPLCNPFCHFSLLNLSFHFYLGITLGHGHGHTWIQTRHKVYDNLYYIQVKRNSSQPFQDRLHLLHLFLLRCQVSLGNFGTGLELGEEPEHPVHLSPHREERDPECINSHLSGPIRDLHPLLECGLVVLVVDGWFQGQDRENPNHLGSSASMREEDVTMFLHTGITMQTEDRTNKLQTRTSDTKCHMYLGPSPFPFPSPSPFPFPLGLVLPSPPSSVFHLTWWNCYTLS